MKNLLKALLEKDPKKRPKIITVLKFPKIAERIGSLLSNEVYQKEFLQEIQKRPMKEKLAELKRMKKQAKDENEEVNKIAAQIAEKVNLEESNEVDK